MNAPSSGPEFSRSVAIVRLGATESIETIEANERERTRLAARFGIVAVSRFVAVVRLRRLEGGLIHVSGRLEADIVQTCVVTLEAFPSHVEDSFSADFSEAASRSEPDGPDPEIIVDIDYEPPEPIEGGHIDIGELASQFLALALDPHPRAPGASLDEVWPGTDDPELSPFAVLAKLKPVE